MMKKVVIAALAASSVFAVTPAFSATQASVIASCGIVAQGEKGCVDAVQAFLASLPAAQRVEAGRSLAAALAQEGLNAGGAKGNFVAGLNALSEELAALDPQLSQQVADLSTSLGSGQRIQTAAAGAPQAASAN
jgi:hypothetical protein